MGSVAQTFNCKNCGNMFWAFTQQEADYWRLQSNKDLAAFVKERQADHDKVCRNKSIV